MWLDVEQNSDEWFEMRLGRVTGSKAATIMANYGKAFGNPAVEYAQRLALERVTGVRDSTDSLKSNYLDRGHELEPVARFEYEKETMNFVSNGGFFKNEKTGDSPDGLVGTNGVVEIKSVIPNIQWKVLKSKKYPTSHKWQIQWHLWISKRKWCDFISFCPEMVEGKQLFIDRVFPDLEAFKQIEYRLAEFELKIKENILILKS